MIQANELRSGNVVISKTHSIVNAVVEGFTPQGLVFLKGVLSYAMLSEIDPIPITTDVLKMCGFKWVPDIYRWVEPKTKYEVIEYGPGYGFENAICREVEQPKLLWLHQLQNLFFALTGRELVVKR